MAKRDVVDRLHEFARDPIADLAGRPKRVPLRYRNAVRDAVDEIQRLRRELAEVKENAKVGLRVYGYVKTLIDDEEI